MFDDKVLNLSKKTNYDEFTCVMMMELFNKDILSKKKTIEDLAFIMNIEEHEAEDLYGKILEVNS